MPTDEDRKHLDDMAILWAIIFAIALIALISYWVTHACNYGC